MAGFSGQSSQHQPWTFFSMAMQHVEPEDTELCFEQVSLWSPSGHVRLLHEISFCIPQSGHKVGLMGPSGSGKTTLLRLINRLVEPSTGCIYWQGQPLSHYPAPALRQQVMLVPQEPRLLGMTVAQAMAYPLQIQNLSPEKTRVQVQYWCERLEIPDAWHARQEQELSIGQRQWVCLGRALVAQPKILLLDEPTSALDSGRVWQMIQVLQSLDCTILLASHHRNVVEQLCEHLLWITQGTIWQDKPINQVDWSALQDMLDNHAQNRDEFDD
jgi:D-methionine transport system ATP-binding protein